MTVRPTPGAYTVPVWKPWRQPYDSGAVVARSMWLLTSRQTINTGLSSLPPFASSLPPKAATHRLRLSLNFIYLMYLFICLLIFLTWWSLAPWIQYFWECWFEPLVSFLQSGAVCFHLRRDVLFQVPTSSRPENSLQGQWRWLWVSVGSWETCLPSSGAEYIPDSCPNRYPALPFGIIFGVPITSPSVGVLARVCPEVRTLDTGLHMVYSARWSRQTEVEGHTRGGKVYTKGELVSWSLEKAGGAPPWWGYLRSLLPLPGGASLLCFWGECVMWRLLSWRLCKWVQGGLGTEGLYREKLWCYLISGFCIFFLGLCICFDVKRDIKQQSFELPDL